MTATYVSAEVERLVREAREDDARMTPGPWETSEPSEYIICDQGAIGDTYCGRTEDIANAAGITRTRNNLRAMADQIEAARTRIAELEVAIRGVLDVAPAVTDAETDTIEHAWADGRPVSIPPLLRTARQLAEAKSVLRIAMAR